MKVIYIYIYIKEILQLLSSIPGYEQDKRTTRAVPGADSRDAALGSGGAGRLQVVAGPDRFYECVAL
jgi:hypothetical protein